MRPKLGPEDVPRAVLNSFTFERLSRPLIFHWWATQTIGERWRGQVRGNARRMSVCVLGGKEVIYVSVKERLKIVRRCSASSAYFPIALRGKFMISGQIWQRRRVVLSPLRVWSGPPRWHVLEPARISSRIQGSLVFGRRLNTEPSHRVKRGVWRGNPDSERLPLLKSSDAGSGELMHFLFGYMIHELDMGALV